MKCNSPWGKEVKKAMIDKDMTLEKLCKSIGYSKTYVSAIINGRLVVPDEVVEKISIELDIDSNLSLTR